jgi:hypothetical protein
MVLESWREEEGLNEVGGSQMNCIPVGVEALLPPVVAHAIDLPLGLHDEDRNFLRHL